MKKFALLFSFIALLHGTAAAAEAPTMGYVDLRKLLVESKVGQKNKAELDKLIKEKEKALTSEEGKLQSIQRAFQKDMLLMTDDQKQAKQKEFQEKAEAYQKLVNEAKQAVGKKDNEFASQSLAEIKKIIAVVAKEMKLSLVLEASESGMLYAEDGMDLTQKVFERYDAKAK
ncbi:MAG: OmpH family outer membrane protein [Sulfuricaulis sp.]|nr:OmpH family outer membrane protein [Sulfuricaulis sp.]